MQRNQKIVLIIAILASLVAFLDGSVVNVALPAIAAELGGGLPLQTWVVDAYLITLGSLMLLAGSLSDLFGRQYIMRIGLIIFLAGSLLCAIAPTGELLIAFRAIQGVGGALLVPSSLALIVSAFSGSAQGKAIGTWTAWTGMAFVFGPLLGGFFVDLGSWRMIFAINIVPIALTLWLLTRLRREDTTKARVKVDYTGALLCTVGLTSLVYGLIEQGRNGWQDPLIIGSLILGTVMLVVFWLYERRQTHPMLPPTLFHQRNFSVGNAATFSIYAGLSIATFLLVIFVQQIGGYSATQAGLAVIPVTVIMLFLSSLFGKLASQYGPRWFMGIGPLVAAAGFVSMLMIDERVLYMTQMLPGILLFGLGLSLTVSPLTTAVLAAAPSREAGIASAVNNMIARVAGLIGIALIGTVMSAQLDVAGFHNAVLVTAALLAIGGIVSAIGIENKPNSELTQS